jgi:hypothetical protein
MGKLENEYQGELIKRIKKRFPGAFVLKNDEQYLSGIPDLTVLHCKRWAVLEVKRNEKAMRSPRPLQEYYLGLFATMGGFAAFIYPSIELEVLDAMAKSFDSSRKPCRVESEQTVMG